MSMPICSGSAVIASRIMACRMSGLAEITHMLAKVNSHRGGYKTEWRMVPKEHVDANPVRNSSFKHGRPSKGGYPAVVVLCLGYMPLGYGQLDVVGGKVGQESIMGVLEIYPQNQVLDPKDAEENM
jgi:hypothetical protein